jgi:hypothetical protein
MTMKQIDLDYSHKCNYNLWLPLVFGLKFWWKAKICYQLLLDSIDGWKPS